jgi:hypothetical protein
MRLAVLTLLALLTTAAVLTAPAAANTGADASTHYRLCQNPATHYLVVAVHNARCARGHRVAKEYFRRLYGQSEGSWRHVLGYSCGSPRNGMYYGLFGSRAYCHRGGARIRFDYRGE